MVARRITLRSMSRRTATLLIALAAMMSAHTRPAPARDVEVPPPQPVIVVPEQAQPILPLREVRVGQRGYGLTVFQGTAIEPFPVEVVSVMSDFEPRRGVIWIRCDEPRLAVSGPVQGMSGSPIYLWDEGEAQEPGRGGRLIGAFAYGFSLSKICLAGVQPIEQMREVAGRAGQGDDKEVGLGGPHAGRMLATLRQTAPQHGVVGLTRAQLDALASMYEAMPGSPPHDAAASAITPAGPPDEGRVMPLLLPLSVGSPEQAALLRPLLAPLGIAAMGAPVGMNTLAGPPPLGVDAAAARIEPGSVLSVPLGFGDLDLAAAGTVTDVLPDGRVLGFGHAMFGQGRTALPMATGYVHTVVPLLTTSFKLSGSLRMAGALVRDENSAVVGDAGGTFVTAPVNVRISIAGQLQREYNYRIINHRMYSPILAAIVTIQSLMAEQQLPVEHTLKLSGHVTFAGGRSFELDSTEAGSGIAGVVYQLMPPIAAMVQNPFEPVTLERVEVTIEVEPTLRSMSIIEGRIDRAEVAPGDTLGISVRMQPYGGQATTRRIAFPVPADMQEGEYELFVCDGANYLHRTMMSRPHRMAVRSVDDLVQQIRDVLSADSTAVYAMLQLPEQGLAYGRTELPRLPSSRRAMVQTATTTGVTPYVQWLTVKTPVEAVTSGELRFAISVRRPFKTQ
jgi:hypothetical protein